MGTEGFQISNHPKAPLDDLLDTRNSALRLLINPLLKLMSNTPTGLRMPAKTPVDQRFRPRWSVRHPFRFQLRFVCELA